MARRRQPFGRKRRTREHVIADLGVNYLERKALECGYALERVKNDYGIDADLATFDEKGQVESGYIRFQVKSTDTLQTTTSGETIRLRVLIADLKTWLYDINPVIVVHYDAIEDRAFWLDIQEYVREYAVESDARTLTLRIPTGNLLTADAIRDMRIRKNGPTAKV